MGLLALAQPTEAKIIYRPAHDKLVAGNPLGLDLNHDRVVDFYLAQGGADYEQTLKACQHVQSSTRYGKDCFLGIPDSTNEMRALVNSKGAPFASALPYGEKIQHGDRFAKDQMLGGVSYYSDTSSGMWFGPWMNGGKGVKHRYLGLKFKINGRFHFGWARVSVATTRKGGDRFTTTLTGYAYETIPGKAIVAGKTKGPDVITVSPASLGHLAAGASAIPAWRSGR
jgi:hypothetical protein